MYVYKQVTCVNVNKRIYIYMFMNVYYEFAINIYISTIRFSQSIIFYIEKIL